MNSRPRSGREGVPRILREDQERGPSVPAPWISCRHGSPCPRQAVTWDTGPPVSVPACLRIPGLWVLSPNTQNGSFERGLREETEIAVAIGLAAGQELAKWLRFKRWGSQERGPKEDRRAEVHRTGSITVCLTRQTHFLPGPSCRLSTTETLGHRQLGEPLGGLLRKQPPSRR